MGGSGAPTEWDDVLGWMPEVLRIHVDAAVAHLRRTMGSSDPEGAFELAFRLCDVTEHATRYCALLAVAVASADEGLRHGVLAELGRMARHKPSFGHWTGLLRTSLAQLDRAAPKALPPPARLSRRRKKDLRAIGEIVNHRNRLAHGASGRYVLHPEQVAALSERVLGVLAGLEDLLTAELQEHRDRLYWHEGEESTFLHPLIVPAPDGPPLLFDHLHGGKRCPVFRGPDEDLRRADLRPAFDGLLRGDRARFEPLEVETLTLPELHERADVVRREPLPSATRWPGLLTALAPLGGRPLFGERLVRGLADGEGPRLYHVYGALGAGKQRFLADVFGRLREEGLDVVPARASTHDPEEPLARLWSRELALTGSFADLAAASARLGARLVLVLTEVETLVVHEALRTELAGLLEAATAAGHVRLLLVSHLEAEPVADLVPPGTCRVVQLPLPPLAEEHARELYEGLERLGGDPPRTPWTELPREAQVMAAHPPDLARLVALYGGEEVPEDFSRRRYHEENWRREVLEVPSRRDVVLALAAWMVDHGRTDVPLAAWEEHAPQGPEAHRDVEDLLFLGVLTEGVTEAEGGLAASLRFRRHGLLLRAVALLFATERTSPPGPRDLAELLARADRAPAGMEGLARWAAEGGLAAPLLARALRAGPTHLPHLVETLLVEAAGPELRDALLEQVVTDGREEVLDAAAAAGTRFLEAGLVPEGGHLLEQVINACGAHGHRRLWAVLVNRHAMDLLGLARTEACRGELGQVLEVAMDLDPPDHDLAHAASNNLARLALTEAARHARQGAQERANRLLSETIDDLPVFTRPDLLWHNRRTTHQHLAQALGQLDPPRLTEAREQLGLAVELCRRHGSYTDLARALDGLADLELAAGDHDRALDLTDQALEHMRRAVDLEGEAIVLANRTDLCLRRDLAAGVPPLRAHSAARRGFEVCRAILRSCRRGRQTDARIAEAGGRLAFACLSVGESARLAALAAFDESARHYRDAGLEQEMAEMADWVRTLEEDPPLLELDVWSRETVDEGRREPDVR